MATKVMMKPGLQKKLLSKKAKTKKIAHEEYLMDQATFLFQERQNRKDTGDEIF